MLRYVLAQIVRDATTVCDLATDATVQAIAVLASTSSGDCESVVGDAMSNRGTDPIDASEQHPTVVSVERHSKTADVRINFGVDPESAATIEDGYYTAQRVGNHWLVDEAEDK